jgi:tRNA-specific 2-thiouridylase
MSVQKKVMIAISGGVDSAVAAAQLLKEGYQCAGVFVRMQPPNCTNADNLKGDLADAQNVCKQLGIPLHIVDYSWDMRQIIDYFAHEYAMARTPNPCVRCNARLKFGKLLAFARSMGAEFLATGHYARIVTHDGLPRLARGVCREKDQSYVLFGIRRAELGSILFPNGEVENKQALREKAKELNLAVHDKGDSQEICFVPDDDYVKFLTAYHPELDQPGPIIDTEGKILGEHKGVFRYTIGQRRGLRIAAGSPIYVIKIDPVTNVVTVGPREALARTELLANDVNWHIDKPKGPIEVRAQIRYAHKAATATLEIVSDDRVSVKFDKPQSAITPGQAVVFYDSNLVIGGGWITSDVHGK